jgi:hypothetical protein
LTHAKARLAELDASYLDVANVEVDSDQLVQPDPPCEYVPMCYGQIVRAPMNTDELLDFLYLYKCDVLAGFISPTKVPVALDPFSGYDRDRAALSLDASRLWGDVDTVD